MSAGNIVLGIDPGFVALGWTLMALYPDGENVLAAGVIRTESTHKKRGIRKCDDQTERSRSIARELRKLVFEPFSKDSALPLVICVESMSLTPKANRAAWHGMGRVWGVVAALADFAALPLVQCFPQEAKKAVLGRSNGGKDEIEAALRDRWGPSLGAKVEHITPSFRNHAFDAMAAVLGCAEADAVQMVRRQGGRL